MAGFLSAVRPLALFQFSVPVVGRQLPYSEVQGDLCTDVLGDSLDLGDGIRTALSNASLISSRLRASVSLRGGV